MTHHAHLISFKIASAIRESCLTHRYSLSRFYHDLMAGITVGIVAVPLSLALAIASGVPPQYGLYTAMIAGFITALLGGSRYSVSGPTAAFVIILHPITEHWGLSGLLVATILSGIILVLMALARLGRLIEYIPEPVTIGFTAGIGVVIATLQLKDFLGLNLSLPESYVGKVEAISQGLSSFQWPSLFVGVATLLILITWNRCHFKFPGHLPALLVGIGASLFLTHSGYAVETIASRFHYVLPTGETGSGIPPILPSFAWPWSHLDSEGNNTIPITIETVRALLPAAFSIAMLAAIESLLCAVVLDRITNTRHYSNGELFAQGVSNIIAPFFGGITSTAAIARSVVNYRAGAQTPIASMLHAIMVILSILLFAGILGYLPMPSIAALLFMVAWNMSEPPKVISLIRKAPLSDIVIFGVCFSLTVLIDMVVAIGVGIALASILFVRDISKMTKVSDVSHDHKHIILNPPPNDWGILKINGPLFFAAADRIFGELMEISEGKKGIILHMESVSIIDSGGISAFEKFIEFCAQKNIRIIIADLQFQPFKTLDKARIKPIENLLIFVPTLQAGLQILSMPNQGGVFGML